MRTRVVLPALAALQMLAEPATAQIAATRRSARVQVLNSTGQMLNHVVVRHRYADRFAMQAVFTNVLEWRNVPNTGVTYAQKVDYRTGLITTAVDFWEVAWMVDGDDWRKILVHTNNDQAQQLAPNRLGGVWDFFPWMYRGVTGWGTTVVNSSGEYAHQHMLTAADADRVLTIEVRGDGQFVFTSPSGSTTDNSYAVSTTLGETDRPLTTGLTALGSNLYLARGNALYAIDPIRGLTQRSHHRAGSWTLLTGLGNSIYFFDDNRLHRLELGSDRVFPVQGMPPRAWRNVSAMTAFGPYLYVVSENQLFLVDPATGNVVPRNGQAAGGWPSVAGMAATNAGLFIVTEDQLYQADPNSGIWQPRHGQGRYGWPAVAAMTSLGGTLYIVTANQLYAADPQTGNWSPRSGQRNAAWGGTEGMAALGDHLYIVQRGLLHRVDPGSGVWTELPNLPDPRLNGT